MDRVGIDWVRACVVEDADSRRALFERLDPSQRIGETAPRAARATPAVERSYRPLAGLTPEAAE